MCDTSSLHVHILRSVCEALGEPSDSEKFLMIPEHGWCPGWLKEHIPKKAAWSSMRGDDGVLYCGQCLRVKEPEKYAAYQARHKAYAEARRKAPEFGWCPG